MLRFVSTDRASDRAHLASVGRRARRLPGRRGFARRDWLLLLAAFDGAPAGLDPVRLQEAMFLFSWCPGLPPRSKYVFEAGPYGPVSDELYADLDRLVGDRLLEATPVRGLSWPLYKPVTRACEQARRILRRADDDDLVNAARRLHDIKQYVSSVGFGELFERIRVEHPEFAVNSVFREAA